jgi:hypothetical protein
MADLLKVFSGLMTGFGQVHHEIALPAASLLQYCRQAGGCQ